jgi:type III secretion protein T
MIEALPLQAFIDRIFPFLATWMIVGGRFLGFAMVFPLFSWLNLSPIVRAAFAAAMAAPIAYHEWTSPTFAKTLTAVDLAALTSKELFLGLLIGLLAGLPFWAAQNCGELIDTYRGSSAGNLFDPSLTTETSELGAGSSPPSPSLSGPAACSTCSARSTSRIRSGPPSALCRCLSAARR